MTPQLYKDPADLVLATLIRTYLRTGVGLGEIAEKYPGIDTYRLSHQRQRELAKQRREYAERFKPQEQGL